MIYFSIWLSLGILSDVKSDIMILQWWRRLQRHMRERWQRNSYMAIMVFCANTDFQSAFGWGISIQKLFNDTGGCIDIMLALLATWIVWNTFVVNGFGILRILGTSVCWLCAMYFLFLLIFPKKKVLSFIEHFIVKYQALVLCLSQINSIYSHCISICIAISI